VPGGAARFSKALRMDGNDLRASGLEKRIAKRAGSLACRERTRWREKREKRKTVEKPKSKSRAPQKHRKPHDCLGAAQALATRKPVPTAPPTTAPQRRWAHQKTTLHHRAAHPNHLQRHKRPLRPPARPQWAALQVSCPAHRSSSAPSQDARSPSVGRTRWRATSMRPRESEGSRRRTRMTTGKSGANAPDRNRGRPPSGPPDRGATYEATSATQKQAKQSPADTPQPHAPPATTPSPPQTTSPATSPPHKPSCTPPVPATPAPPDPRNPHSTPASPSSPG